MQALLHFHYFFTYRHKTVAIQSHQLWKCSKCFKVTSSERSVIMSITLCTAIVGEGIILQIWWPQSIVDTTAQMLHLQLIYYTHWKIRKKYKIMCMCAIHLGKEYTINKTNWISPPYRDTEVLLTQNMPCFLIWNAFKKLFAVISFCLPRILILCGILIVHSGCAVLSSIIFAC